MEGRRTKEPSAAASSAATGGSNSSSSGIVGRRKVLVVKKRKKVAPKKAAAGLPSFQRRRPAKERIISTATDTATSSQEDDYDDAFDTVLASLPNDCALGIQALQQNADTCLAIPLPSDPSHYLHGVLERSLYQKLQQDATKGDTVVSHELAELLTTNQIRKLSSPAREANPLQVLVWTSDYQRAAWNTVVTNETNSQQCTEWMLRQLQYLTSQRIAVADWEERWRVDSLAHTNLNAVLDRLTRQELLLFLPLEQAYQLWLPTWGVVLQAWETARKKVLANLKRSSYKERSLRALQQTRSPISSTLLLEWMESVGQVELVDRPAGRFARLPTEDG